jgi:hypothetical protein
MTPEEFRIFNNLVQILKSFEAVRCVHSHFTQFGNNAAGEMVRVHMDEAERYLRLNEPLAIMEGIQKVADSVVTGGRRR